MGDADLSAAPAAASRPAMAASDPFAVAGDTLLAILFWEGLVLASEGWVPSTVEIVVALVDRLLELNTYAAVGISLGRIAVAFAGSFLIGVAVGFAMGLWHWVDAFWRPIVAIALAIPDPVYFIMAILILGPGESVSLLALTLAVCRLPSASWREHARARLQARRHGADLPYYRLVLCSPRADPADGARHCGRRPHGVRILVEDWRSHGGADAVEWHRRRDLLAFRLFKSAETIAARRHLHRRDRGIQNLPRAAGAAAAAWRN